MSDRKGLCAKLVRLGGDTEPDVACFAAESCIRHYICSSILVATRSLVIALPALHLMTAGTGAMNGFV